MSQIVAALYCGTHERESQSPRVEFRRLNASDLADVTRDRLRAVVDDVDARAVWLVGSEAPADFDIKAVADGNGDSAAGPDAIHVVAANPSPLASAWNALPPRLAVLAADPTRSVTIAVDRDRLLTALDDGDGGGPFVWPWLVRELAADASAIRAGALDDVDHAERWPALSPAAPAGSVRWLRERIEALSDRELGGRNGSDRSLVKVRAGLLQMNDFVEESHQLAQSIQGDADGDYWHAIVHRREPDASNAKYWCRRAGRHPVHERLPGRVERLLQERPSRAAEEAAAELVDAHGWNAAAFVDVCESARTAGEEDLIRFCERLQFEEMLLLLGHCLKSRG